MRTLRLCSVAILIALLCACAREPTPIDVPPGATSVERFPIRGGAFQTQFTLQATYPAAPALDFYRAHIAKPWVLCEWSGPEWGNFIDATGKAPVGVHQLLYMWINREANRTLMLSLRYDSAPDSHSAPDNDSQSVLLVEYMAPDIPGLIKGLKLRCPSGDVAAL
jgi:hypothetical protein